MKKLTGILLALGILASCSTPREEILKVYNWADYIDEDLITEFEQWYEEQTGEKVTIIYQTFDVNETMLSKIELGHEDYDLVCPSDYIIERMLMNDLLLPIDRDFGDTPDYTVNLAPYIVDCFNNIEGFGKNANDYAVGYMWGTTGLIYNPKFVSAEDVKSWDVLRDPKNAGHILMKEAFRDVYSVLLVALNKDAIDAGEKDLATICFDNSDESIKMVEDYLMSFRDGVCGWEADFGKDQMTKEQAWINLSWSGDAQWAIEEAAEMGVELAYSVPESGSVVWFDGWVIPKYAKNVKAARYFINFMCKPENAIRNMDVIGYVSALGGDYILEQVTDEEEFDPIDVSYFFGPQADSVCVNPIMYPEKAIIDRCSMMHDSSEERTRALLEMWSRVKGDSATGMTFVTIVCALLAIAALVLFLFLRKKSRRASARRRR